MSFWKKITQPSTWEKIFYERLTEPAHLNLLSLGVMAFGSFRQKVNFDLVLRHHAAFGLLKAADLARQHGIPEVQALEFGVAAGAGLINMARIAEKITAETGVRVKLTGFDTGKGMPKPIDYRDHPDLYGPGDYPMDFAKLQAALPANVRLVIGELAETVPAWLKANAGGAPIGYAAIDVDYYSSSVEAFKVFEGPATSYLPFVVVYLDDIHFDVHNSWCGERLAMGEFNERNRRRKLEQHAMLRRRRVFKNAPWLEQIFYLHVLDHPVRETADESRAVAVLNNPFL